MRNKVQAVPYGQIKLLPGLFQSRAKLNRSYVMSLNSVNLLQNFYTEANLYEPMSHVHEHWEPQHLGWESPACPLRGHFLGHWLSSAAKLYAATGDTEAKGKADWIVEELGRCQIQNGGEWAGSIPEKYLHWIAEGKHVWAPHYTLHKTLMGLYDMYAYAGSQRALEIIDQWSNWFYRWTGELSEETLADVLDVETGAMMEVWADIYAATGKKEHLELMRRYTRNRLFEPLLRGEDVLTNMHANTTIPEIHGAARAYEVTGEQKWRDIAEAYWKSAVTDRGTYCTGSQTSGEIWSPPGELSARLGGRNQEHCVVYNMIRLADFLYRWSGSTVYLDYIERNLYNGIFAQQHPKSGMITYFLPLHAGATKKWGSPTKHFWCCHGSLVQAHTIHANLAFYTDDEGVIIAQYMPSELKWNSKDGDIHIKQTLDPQTNWGIRDTSRDQIRRPSAWAVNISVICKQDTQFTVKLRLPDWLHGAPIISVNGQPAADAEDEDGYIRIRRTWRNGDHLHLQLPKILSVSPLPDRPDIVSFMDGPVVLAGLCDEERTLRGNVHKLETLIIPDNEREWAEWLPGYRTINQERGFRFIPLYEVEDQRYTVYFPVKEGSGATIKTDQRYP
ncbi:glycoside hydrolase family 127 protein [Paenibacillus frigoriresistens]|uniref:beta-L-arabinofuranosidase domain-containing protein n=1 Tax=Paenibacillus alginolyticus TaxID=59839 RepID=UPI0015656302|nr:beta-L-arabinofuranosidase domain-containing protein [Paenibacillus frigoriresistens]NRF93758.1 glycoside hydrolase family 127 protein [Paenibacillus frigoriresistens]